jgi:hypothetical protein
MELASRASARKDNIAQLAMGKSLEKNDVLVSVNLDFPIDETIKKSILGIDGILYIFAVCIGF